MTKREKQKTLLITGGAGFMGSHFIKYALKHHRNWRVVNVDKLSYSGNLNNLKEIGNHNRYKFILGDIADANIVRNIFKLEHPDIVINYAAETLVDRSIAGPKIFVEANIIGTQNLLDAIRECTQVQKMIQISTDEVYGEILQGKAREDHVCHPRNPYAATKAGADHIVISYINTYQIPAIVTRSCNFYGANQYPEKLIPIFITNLIQGKKLYIHGNGKQSREWIFTEDHCRAIDCIIKKGKIGEIYNIGTGHYFTVSAIAMMMLNAFSKSKDIIEHTQDRPGNDQRYALNWNKLQALGWKPSYHFEKGLKETIAWYKTNEWWWKEILADSRFAEYYKHKYLKII